MADRTRAPEVDPTRCTVAVTRIGQRHIVRLPAEASAQLPSRGQVAATVVIDGHAITTVLEPDGRRGHWISLETGLVQTLDLGEGTEVAIEIRPTKDWPEPEAPLDFTRAMGEASDVADVWEDITPMARWEWVRWFNATMNPQTRERRIAVGISKLQSGKRRPCCFDLASCTDPELSKSGKLVDPE